MLFPEPQKASLLVGPKKATLWASVAEMNGLESPQNGRMFPQNGRMLP